MRVQRTRSSPSAHRSPLTRCPLGGTIGLVVGLVVGCSAAAPSYRSDLPVVNYCDLVEHAATFNGQVVRVRGIYISGYEHSLLTGDSCEALTWVDLDQDWQVNSTASAKRVFKDPNENVLAVVAVGRFSGTGIREFGHLLCCGFHLDLSALEQATPTHAPPANR